MAYVVRKRSIGQSDALDPFFRKHVDVLSSVPIREPRPTGFPLLFASTGALIEPAVAFLHEHLVHRACSEETLKTYSDLLYDWFETMEQFGCDWRNAKAVDLFAYRNRMRTDASEHTKRAYSAKTINHRVRGVVRFYKWMLARRWISSSEIVDQDVRALTTRSAESARFRLSRSDRSIFTVRQFDDMPRPLSPPQARELLATLNPPYDLMARWQLFTGLRVGELLRLRITDVQKPGADRDADHQQIDIIRKGRKKGFILASRSLLDETEIYISTHRRAETNRQPRKKAVSQALFLTSRGESPSKNWYQRLVARTSRKCGFSATTHTLRSTFACMMSSRLIELVGKGKELNPLLIVKALMGHEHIETTDRYLRAVDVTQASLFEALDTLSQLEEEP